MSRWFLSLVCSLSLLACLPALAAEVTKHTGRVDRVFTNQFFTVNDGRAGEDLAVFVPDASAAPVRGERVEVTGVMRPFEWGEWVSDESWFREGWGLVHEGLVEFDGKPVLVAHSVIEPTGNDLALASNSGVEQESRPTLGERKLLEQSHMRAVVRGSPTGPAGAGGAPGAAGGAATAGGAGTAGAAGTAAGSPSPGAVGTAGGALTVGGATRDTRDTMAPTRQPETQAPGPATQPGERPETAPGQAQPGAIPGTTPGAPAIGMRLFSPGELVADPDAYEGPEILVSGTVVRRTDPATVELLAGAEGEHLVVFLEQQDIVLHEGQRVLVTGRLSQQELGPSDARAAEGAGARGNERAPVLAGRVLSEAEANQRVVAATPRAISRDPSLFVGRRVSLVADAGEVLGPHAFMVREEGSPPGSGVLVITANPGTVPVQMGRVRVFGTVEILRQEDPASRIDPAWLEGVDRLVFLGRPVIVADSITEPENGPVGRR